MVKKLENDPESFTLWACCVPAFWKSGSRFSWKARNVAVLLIVLALIFYIALRALKIL